ncbi:hypothetical protein QUF80_14255 [Desulfococcaceae bacterium HSG8]|nr:hypothetical protein [Desulfococcaceae bacterium HSG8]
MNNSDSDGFRGFSELSFRGTFMIRSSQRRMKAAVIVYRTETAVGETRLFPGTGADGKSRVSLPSVFSILRTPI